MASVFEGTWEYIEDSPENADEVLSAMGITDEATRTVYKTPYNVEITIKDGSINSSFLMKGMKEKFPYATKLGEWQDVKGPTGDMFKFRPTIHGNVMTEESNPLDGKPGTVSTRTVKDGIMVIRNKVTTPAGTVEGGYKLKKVK